LRTLAWGAGAEAVYEDYRQECYSIPPGVPWVLANRNAEKAVRMATCVALGCGEGEVSLEAVRWGIEVARLCYAEMMRGIERYSMAKLAQPDFTRRVEEYLIACGDRASQTEVTRHFRNSIHNNELWRARTQLLEESRLRIEQVPGAGRSTNMWVLETDEA
jgi:hypothetical protein